MFIYNTLEISINTKSSDEMDFRKEEKSKSLFQKQLENGALKKIVFWVIAGCLLFCIPIFGFNFLNLHSNVNKHLNYLNRIFDDVYDSTAKYLETAENTGAFLRCITHHSDGREVEYSINKYNIASPIRINLILADNVLKGETSIYNTVYYFSGDHSEYVFSKPLYQHQKLVGFVTAYLNGSDWRKLFSDYQYDNILTNLNGNITYWYSVDLNLSFCMNYND